MRPVLLYAGTCALIAALFLLFPGIDIAATRLFYDSAQGFFLADSAPVRIVEAGVKVWHLELERPTLEQRFLRITSTVGDAT